MINYKDFANRYYQAANENRLKDIERFINSVNDISKNISLEKVLLNKELICKVFYIQDKNSISRTQYQKTKEYLLNLSEFVGLRCMIPTRSDVLDSCERINYFGSLKKLLNFVDYIGHIVMPAYNETKDLIRVKAICILGWFGVSLNEISELKKIDLKPIGTIGFKILYGQKEINLFEELFEVFVNLMNLTTYTAIPGSKTVYLDSNSPYLFCPLRGDLKGNPNSISQELRRFNSVIPTDITTSIVFRNLRPNALFLKIYKNQPEENELIETITKIMGCERTYAYSYKDQYLRFAKAMDNRKI